MNNKKQNNIFEKTYIVNKDKEFEPYLYHYTDIEALYKILSGDSLRAGHVRFSNDIEEYDLGVRILSAKNCKSRDDAYVICLCPEGDLKSQFSEYCRGKIGVSIGFDFSGFQEFHDLNDGKYCFEYVKQINETEDYINLVKPQRVIYCAPKGYIVPKRFTKIAVSEEEIKEEYNKISDEEKRIGKYAPLIKHIGYADEDEYRLIFVHSNINNKISNYTHFTEDAKTGILKPGIIVKCRNSKIKNNLPSQILIKYYKNEIIKYDTIKNEFYLLDILYYTEKSIELYKEELIKKIRTIFSRPKKTDKIEIFLPQCVLQEKLYFALKEALLYTDMSDNCKIWCGGHLPIRKIIIQTHPESAIIKNSLDCLIKKNYWQEDIDIVESKIPYRKR